MDAKTRKVLEEALDLVPRISDYDCMAAEMADWCRQAKSLLASPDDAVGELRMDAERFRFMADAVMKATGVDIRIGVDEKMRAAEQSLAATLAASNVKKGRP